MVPYQVPALALYWINMISAVLDNATMTAIESMPNGPTQDCCRSYGLAHRRGMLIPGNIPTSSRPAD